MTVLSYGRQKHHEMLLIIEEKKKNINKNGILHR